MPSEHSELVEEMQDIEKLPTVERLKLARKRRLQQLKKYAEYEKRLEKLERGTNKKNSGKASAAAAAGAPPSPAQRREARASRRLVFADSIVFLDAASRNDVDEVRNLLERGVNPDVANDDGLTALHQCAIDDGVDMAALLLEYAANVNALDSEMWTPLHAAATCGHIRICQQLVQAGANLLAVNADGNMPYDICEDEATLEFVETEMANMGVTQELIDSTRMCHSQAMLADMQAICDSGGDLETKDKNGVVPLHIAAANGYYNVVVYLMEKGVAVDPTDSDGWTPLHAAACWGQMSVVEILARFGADLDAKTLRGETVLDICEDPELKQQIEDMKRTLMTDRERQKDPFKQHRNSTHNTRGASIRRHSMRDKHRLSLKEAKEEALMFGAADKDDGTVTSPDDVDLESSLGGEGRDPIDPFQPSDVAEDGDKSVAQESVTRDTAAAVVNADRPAADRGPPAANNARVDNGSHDVAATTGNHQKGAGDGTSGGALALDTMQQQPTSAPGAATAQNHAPPLPVPPQPKSALAKHTSTPVAPADAMDGGKADRSKNCCSIL